MLDLGYEGDNEEKKEDEVEDLYEILKQVHVHLFANIS